MPTHDVLANKVPTIHCALLGATFRPPVAQSNYYSWCLWLTRDKKDPLNIHIGSQVTKLKNNRIYILRYSALGPPPNFAMDQRYCRQWCGLRPSVLGQDRSETEKSVLVLVSVLHAVVLVLQVWCCVVKHGLVTLVIIMTLKDTQQLFKYTLYSFSILFLEYHYCGDQQWRLLT